MNKTTTTRVMENKKDSLRTKIFRSRSQLEGGLF